MEQVRVRFAPSPTGYLHVGGLRTALFNYLFAKHHKGQCVLRIEDTDQTRLVPEAQENLIHSLSWAGVTFDEGPHKGGEYGPYVQSQRLELYQKHAAQLVEQGDAYPCFCSVARLEEMREKQRQRKQPPRYDGLCRRLSKEEAQAKIQEGLPYVIRMKIIHSQGNYTFNDLIRGDISFQPTQIDDQVILKTDGFPTYHLANVIDDHYMKITHVIRGEEWLSSVPKHIQLYRYFKWEEPQFAHLSLLLNTDRSKLSKRQADVAVEDYMKKGVLPEALVNFIALLGWHTDTMQELFTIDELREVFSLDRIGKSGAVFNTEKLEWMNHKYIQKKTVDELYDLVSADLSQEVKENTEEIQKKMIAAVQSSLSTLSELNEKLIPFVRANEEASPEIREQLKSEDSQAVLRTMIAKLETIDEFTSETIGQAGKDIQKETGYKGKQLWLPLRLALTNSMQGPELPVIADIFGKEKCIAFLQRHIEV